MGLKNKSLTKIKKIMESKFKIKTKDGATVVTNCATGEQKFLIIPKEDKKLSLFQILKKLFNIK